MPGRPQSLGVDGIAHGSGIALATISDPARADELRTFARLGISVDYPFFLMYHAYMDPAKIDDLVDLLVEQNVRIEFEQVNTAGRWVPEYREAWLAEDTRLLQDPNLQYIPAQNRDRVLYYEPYDQLTDQQREQVRQGYEKRKGFYWQVCPGRWQSAGRVRYRVFFSLWHLPASRAGAAGRGGIDPHAGDPDGYPEQL